MNKIQEINQEIKRLKIKEQSAREVVWAIEREIDNLKKSKKNVCTHPRSKRRIVSDSYFEEGRMSGPVYFEKKVCGICGEVVAHLHETVTKKWSDE